jgi:8-oxo-dGTP pyrophosphatase MutT (NUDIX family)
MTRTSARVILLDEHGAVLLLCGSDPAITDGTAPRWWFTPGGEAAPGEPLALTAARELEEETGLRMEPEGIVGPVWQRQSEIHFNGAVMHSDEFYFLHRTRRFEPSTAGRTELELRYIHGHRWCDAEAIEELVNAGQRVYPVQLGELLGEAHALADGSAGETPTTPRPIH